MSHFKNIIEIFDFGPVLTFLTQFKPNGKFPKIYTGITSPSMPNFRRKKYQATVN